MPSLTIQRRAARAAAALGLGLVLCAGARAGGPVLYEAPMAGSAVVVAGGLEQAPYAGPHNYGLQAPTFRYGWFGAEHFTPANTMHKTYYDDVIRWSRWRQY